MFKSLPFDQYMTFTSHRKQVERKIVFVSSTDIKELSQLEESAKQRLIKEKELQKENKELKVIIEKVEEENKRLKVHIEEMNNKMKEMINGLNKNEELSTLDESIYELRYLVSNLLSPNKSKIPKHDTPNKKKTEMMIVLGKYFESRIDLILKFFSNEKDPPMQEDLEEISPELGFDEQTIEQIKTINEKIITLSYNISEHLYQVKLEEKVRVLINKAECLAKEVNKLKKSELDAKISEFTQELKELRECLPEFPKPKNSPEKILTRQKVYLQSNSFINLLDE